VIAQPNSCCLSNLQCHHVHKIYKKRPDGGGYHTIAHRDGPLTPAAQDARRRSTNPSNIIFILMDDMG